jgi:CRISPR-associated protein Cmr6
MSRIPYNGPLLLELLAKQQKERAKNNPELDLFRSGAFIIDWRAKVGSFPSPDVETIISAGEPCGSWKKVKVTRSTRNQAGQWQNNEFESRPEDKRTVEDNFQALRQLPLNGYIPGASIRGIVRSWVNKRQHLRERLQELLGKQEDNEITSGRIEFLDAFPKEPTPLVLDVVNPQQDFQVFHEKQSKPLSLYTLGDGTSDIELVVAIRGIPGKAKPDDVNTVWQWLLHALVSQGIGSRTASGYGMINAMDLEPDTELWAFPSGYASNILTFQLLSQGNSGPNPKGYDELRPSHWRGWLRSWVLRFLLGVMSENNAKLTLGDLLGSINDDSGNIQQKGCIQTRIINHNYDLWGEAIYSPQFNDVPEFYQWEGELEIIAPRDVLDQIIIPIVSFVTMIGGVGRGWRRPLHQFLNNDRKFARGSQLSIKSNGGSLDLPLNIEHWKNMYQGWKEAVITRWPTRFNETSNVNAEVFSPQSCAVYLMPKLGLNPINTENLTWTTDRPMETRGAGVGLVYNPRYKRQRDVGGNAAGGGNSSCSWVSIARKKVGDDYREVVCLFMGSDNALRKRFLNDLSQINGAQHIFGCTPQTR